jgi:hypothetical protein
MSVPASEGVREDIVNFVSEVSTLRSVAVRTRRDDGCSGHHGRADRAFPRPARGILTFGLIGAIPAAICSLLSGLNQEERTM